MRTLQQTSQAQRCTTGGKCPRPNLRTLPYHGVQGTKRVPPPKPRRYRPGTLALREIRKQVNSTDLSIPKRSLARIVRGIVADLFVEHRTKKGVWTKRVTRVEASALHAIQAAAEEYLVEAFSVRSLPYYPGV